jgi:hypothetical protein
MKTGTVSPTGTSRSCARDRQCMNSPATYCCRRFPTSSQAVGFCTWDPRRIRSGGRWQPVARPPVGHRRLVVQRHPRPDRRRHRCFDSPNAFSEEVVGSYRRSVGDYLAEDFWQPGHPQSVRGAGNYHRTISTYLGTLLNAGFRIESIGEPAATPAIARTSPHRSGLPPFVFVHEPLAAGLLHRKFVRQQLGESECAGGSVVLAE